MVWKCLLYSFKELLPSLGFHAVEVANVSVFICHDGFGITTHGRQHSFIDCHLLVVQWVAYLAGTGTYGRRTGLGVAHQRRDKAFSLLELVGSVAAPVSSFPPSSFHPHLSAIAAYLKSSLFSKFLNVVCEWRWNCKASIFNFFCRITYPILPLPRLHHYLYCDECARRVCIL